MRHTRALQRQSDGRWDMATTAGGQSYGVGFCGGKLVTYGLAPVSDGDYHTDGHATKEEAEDCYRRYLATTAILGMFEDTQMRCKVCEAWTQHYAQIQDTVYTLCPDHQTYEDVLAQVKTRAMERWAS